MGLSNMPLSHGRAEAGFDIDIVSKVKADILFSLFYKLFDVVHADTPELKQEAHRIRYQVFCLENEGYEDPAAHPDGMERDEFDDNADHALLIYKPMNLAIGAVRVIKANEENWQKSFPLQSLCDSRYLHDELSVKNSCEFSRLCISKERRNLIKQEAKKLRRIFNNDDGLNLKIYEKPLLHIAMAIAPLGLIRGAFELTTKNNCLNVFGVMEPFHIKRLENAGLVHETIGPVMDYHGKRVPFLCNLLEVYENAMVNNHEIWNLVTLQGKNHQTALDLYDRKALVTH